MRTLCITLISLFLAFSSSHAQQEEISGFWFGPKLGPTVGMQNWDGLDRRAMFNYHGALFMESLDPDYKGSLYAQLGYHSRGSALNIFTTFGAAARQAYTFNNIALQLGAKKRLITTTLSTPYYFVGIRLEYQMNNNLAELNERYNSPFYPVPDYVNDWTYGITFGGGIEFYGSEFIQPALELSISPDMSFQYFSPALGNIIHPFDGRTVTVNERKIRNITLELSLSIRFLRKVVFID